MTHRWLWTAIALVGTVLLVTATGGFSAGQIDRPVSITVAENPENAIVGLSGSDNVTVTYGSSNDTKQPTVELFTVTNNFESSFEFSIQIVGDTNTPPDHQSLSAEKYSLAPGESTKVTANVVCSSQETETWTIYLEVSSSGVEAEIQHDISIVCAGPTSTG
ncbi:hypothetical protein [Halorussus salinus]|uniref:hypothetical protein n=1 Tax=Halorussus salinus TaxID=1364935 RepID=UPI00138F90E4|nr:hypothetical protein [Halorussus salinus]